MKVAARAAAVGVAFAVASPFWGALVARAAPDDAGEDAPAETLATKPAAVGSQLYPLVLLLQSDAVLTSEPQGVGAAAGDDPPAGWALRLRRLRVGEDAQSGAWRARVLLEATSRGQPVAPLEGGRLPVGGPIRLPEAFVAWMPHRAFQLSVGAGRVPFSLSRQVDEADLRLPERAQILTALAPDYRTGVALKSDLGLLDVRLAFMSADTSLDRRLLTSGYLAALRLGADPIGPMGVTPWRRRADDPWYGWWRFSAGASVLYGTLLEPRTLALGGDAQLQWRRLTVTGEYLGEHLPNGPLSWPHQGAALEPGVFLWSEHLELTLRGAWYRQPLEVTPATDDHADTFAGGAGLTLCIYEARLRFQAAFELRRTRDRLLADSSWGIFRATLAL
jgi:hypothetical protein